ncbi:copper amine oxidase N-terminal domain-containing protein [Caldalkalibacillus salinus]|uniref:copper amine oxidase N-terminal domain-containing protein n=1 Tax=Caldalkalibacillus salinus TaxID=2803787 RepID=UPI001921D747|nr:copper amine oxidase N-terminal domain-containing protein [Caldalkalibacillus salinus]
MKSFLATTLLIMPAMHTLETPTAQAHSVSHHVNIVINGKVKQFENSPFISNGTTYVPIRYVSETVGAKVKWDQKTKGVTITKEDMNISFVAGQRGATINGQKVDMPSAQLIKGTTMVPLRFVSEALGLEVAWDAQYKTALIGDTNLVELETLGLDEVKLEVLDWSVANNAFPIGTEATVTDVETGRTFKVKRTYGANHADSEPLTASDAQVMKELWGGSYSWTPRAIILEFGDKKLAAAMHSFPHSVQKITNNGYNGHFCIHFQNSTRHKDGRIQQSMQQKVQEAANSGM